MLGDAGLAIDPLVRSDQRQVARDIHDHAAAPSRHLAAEHTAAQERTHYTDREIRTPLRERKVLEPRKIDIRAILHLRIISGVVDQDVDASEPLLYLRQALFDIRFARDVRLPAPTSERRPDALG